MSALRGLRLLLASRLRQPVRRLAAGNRAVPPANVVSGGEEVHRLRSCALLRVQPRSRVAAIAASGVRPNPSLSRDPTRQAAWASWRAGLCCTTPPKRLAARVAVSSNVRPRMQPPAASLAVVGGSGTFGSGPEWCGYLTAAQSLIAGAQALSASGQQYAEAHTLISGFVTEATLKALLVHAGADQKALRSRSTRHNLVALWGLAAAASPVLTGSAPDWVKALDEFHDHPYVARYMEGVASYVCPRTSEVQAGMEDLLEKAVASVSSGEA